MTTIALAPSLGKPLDAPHSSASCKPLDALPDGGMHIEEAIVTPATNPRRRMVREASASLMEEFEDFVPLRFELRSLRNLVASLLCGSDDRKSVGDSAVAFMSRESTLAGWAFFFGGYARFRMCCMQRMYDAMFLISFIMCLVACVMNLYSSEPPFHNFGIGFATSYLHVIGLHQWLFWREFVLDESFRYLLGSFVPVVSSGQNEQTDTESANSDARVFSDLRSTCTLWGAMLVGLQSIVIALGMVVLPLPAYEASNDIIENTRNRFTMSHAVLMWVAIPQHVPTIVMSIGLYLFVNRVHALDFTRVAKQVANPKYSLLTREAKLDGTQSKESLEEILEASCLLVESAQNRLDHSCRLLQCLWTHQLLYAGFQMLVVVLSATSHLADVQKTPSREAWLKLLLDCWHGAIGSLLFLSALFIPAKLTENVQATPRRIQLGLRVRGWSITELAEKMELGLGQWLKTECTGYRVLIYSVTQDMVVRFITVIVIVASIFVSGSLFQGV